MPSLDFIPLVLLLNYVLLNAIVDETLISLEFFTLCIRHHNVTFSLWELYMAHRAPILHRSHHSGIVVWMVAWPACWHDQVFILKSDGRRPSGMEQSLLVVLNQRYPAACLLIIRWCKIELLRGDLGRLCRSSFCLLKLLMLLGFSLLMTAASIELLQRGLLVLIGASRVTAWITLLIVI